MKEKFIESMAYILIVTILCTPAFIKSYRYNTAIESGYEIEAVVVDYDTKIQSVEYTEDTEIYVLYVDYEVDGKEYKNIKAGESAEFIRKGETIKIVVNPDNPEKIMHEDDLFTGILAVAGVLFGIIVIISTIKNKKKEKEN